MYDAILVVSFGGPEGMSDVLPFLENVLRGKSVPKDRLLAVSQHYEMFGGVSPINEQNRRLIAALKAELDLNGPQLPIYWGNRNWHPMLTDTLRQMAEDGVKRALAFVTSAYSSYSGCRQYLDDIEKAKCEVPAVDKLRVFYNHPGFIKACKDRLSEAMNEFPKHKHSSLNIVFTAHSIPISMSVNCDYQKQLMETCALVADKHSNWQLAFQSRSGPAHQPWLEPDVLGHLRSISKGDVVLMPIGFISDHMEVIYDLDIEARKLCDEIGLNMRRAKTVGTHPDFIKMIRELIVERIDTDIEPRALGKFGPSHSVCPKDCCLTN